MVVMSGFMIGMEGVYFEAPDWRSASSDMQGMKIAVRTTSGRAFMADFSDVPLEKTKL
jgi:hypothetical protein